MLLHPWGESLGCVDRLLPFPHTTRRLETGRLTAMQACIGLSP